MSMSASQGNLEIWPEGPRDSSNNRGYCHSPWLPDRNWRVDQTAEDTTHIGYRNSEESS